MMFYTQLFTSKRGTLAKIWLAAHWERKITKAHVFECNLETTIKDIISPQIKIGLRTSGHLLLGVVRIYSRKAKYLLADCNDALVKIKVAFRPGQTDMPIEGLEATHNAITLVEDFTDFESQLPDLNCLDVADHFSLNQCRTEEITLREDFGNSFLPLEHFGDENQCPQSGLLDISYQSLAYHGDAFGDENTECDLLDFIAYSGEHSVLMDSIPEEIRNEKAQPPTMAVQPETYEDSLTLEPMNDEPPSLNETTLLLNDNEGFALEPVSITPTMEKMKGKRKRRLVVDQAKELSNEAIRGQLSDWSDLVAPLDTAPPTHQLMQWKESGGVERLFGKLSCLVIHPHIQRLFTKNFCQGKSNETADQVDREEQREENLDDEPTAFLESVDADRLRLSAGELTPLKHDINNNPPENHWDPFQDESGLEVLHPELPSEDSLFAHPSGFERETPSTVVQTQSMLDSQDFEEKRMTNRAQRLLNAFKNSSSNAMFSLKALCERSSRSQVAATFFFLLVLKKQQALDLHQSGAYQDIIATPGIRFHGSESSSLRPSSVTYS
ncbi:double-strand-break repair protein rad21-like protein 1 [Aplochiton taeniatus]